LNGWTTHVGQRQDGIGVEAETLICLRGLQGHDEAHRRGFEAKEISFARYLGQVKAEIERRILQDCGMPSIVEPVEARVGCVAALPAHLGDLLEGASQISANYWKFIY
jgi:hypothetical protein